jgi:hypothetical protein
MKDPWDDRRREHDLKLMLDPLEWPGTLWGLEHGKYTFALKRWVETKMEFAVLVYKPKDKEYILYSEAGKLLDRGGVRVPMQAVDNGWVAD